MSEDRSELDDATIVVQRAPAVHLDERTIVVDRGRAPDEEDDRTIVVDRTDSTGGASDLDDRTVVVDRTDSTGAPDLEDRTVVVYRTDTIDAENDRTVVVDRTGTGTGTGTDAAADDATAVVERKPRGRRGRREALVVRGTLPGARRPRPAPIDPELRREATVAPGPGILDHYETRPVPDPTPPPAAVAMPQHAPRADGSDLPSVARRSGRQSALGLAAAAVACVVSVVGLVWIVLALLGG